MTISLKGEGLGSRFPSVLILPDGALYVRDIKSLVGKIYSECLKPQSIILELYKND